MDSPLRQTLWHGGSSRTAWSTWRGMAWNGIPCMTRSAVVCAVSADTRLLPGKQKHTCLLTGAAKALFAYSGRYPLGCSLICLPCQLYYIYRSTRWLLAGLHPQQWYKQTNRCSDSREGAGVPQHWRCALHSAGPAGEVVRVRWRALRALPGAPARHLSG